MSMLARKRLGTRAGWMVLALILTTSSASVAAQKSKDKKKAAAAAAADAAAHADLSSAFPPLPDSQAVDKAVGEALGYWQIGDIDSLHKYYSDDVVFVSGAWEPPVIGWDNFLKAYQAQRAQVPGGRMDRSNTVIKVTGNTAWATYQFVFSAVLEGRTILFHGHTTVILNKQGDHWVIVLNHSSIVDSAPANPSPTADSVQPARP
jgi:ketosteroid isomerase-like protein